MDFNSIYDSYNIFAPEKNKLKEKKFIFLPFILINNDGLYKGEFKDIIIADFFSRFNRLYGYNVYFQIGFNMLIYSSYIKNKYEKKELSSHLIDECIKDIKKLEISFSTKRYINNIDTFVMSGYHKFFLNLYKNGYINYKTKEISYDNINNKLYDSIFKKNYLKKQIEGFFLDLSKIKNKLINNIKSLNISKEYKEEFFVLLDQTLQYYFVFNLSNYEVLDVLYFEFEYTAGIKALFINPDYIDISRLVLDSEKEYVSEFINKKKDSYIYTGVDAINPITGDSIPLFVSFNYKKGIHTLNLVDENDLYIINDLGLEILNIIDANGKIINSDFLNGLSKEEARKKAIEYFLDEDIIVMKYGYLKDDLLLSSLDEYGLMYPVYKNKNGILYLLDDNLPISFSKTFRPIIFNEENIPFEFHKIQGSLNSIFLSMFNVILSMFNENNTDVLNIFNYDNFITFKETLKNNLFIINESNIVYDILILVISLTILEDYHKEDIVSSLEFIITKPVLDKDNRPIKKDYSNLIDVKNLLNKNYEGAIRLFVLLSESDCFDLNLLSKYKNIIYDIKAYFKNDFLQYAYELEHPFYLFQEELKKQILNNDYKGYTSVLINFFKDYIKPNQITKQQAKIFLTYLSCVLPNLADEINYEYIDNKTLIIDYGINK